MKNITKVCLLALCMICFYNSNAGAQTEVTYYTTMGNFKTVLTDALTPRTVDSFIARVAHKFYDGLIFHRVIAGFVVQGGDPLGTGYGGPGYTTPDELVPSLQNVTGALAMANSGPNTDGSQFYINLVNNPSLNGIYTVFGMTTSGMPVVQNIGLVPVDVNDKPLTPVVMDSVRITRAPAAVTNLANGLPTSVYPNPCRGTFNIDLPAIVTKVEIVDMAGRSVYHAEAKGTLPVDFRDQPTGLYFVHLSNVNGSSESKVIVQ